MSTCVVFVCNNKYLSKFKNTLQKLRTNGQYEGDVLLIIGNDLKEQENKLKKNYNIQVKYFPDIVFSYYFYKINDTIKSDGRTKTKKFQWHKLHLFNTFFKKWDYIFYIDCGMRIHRPIQPMLDSKKEGKILAHNDAYPNNISRWRLSIQFEKKHTLFKELEKKYNLEISYFQTGLMFFDTSIVNENTFDDLLKLANKYPICRTNEQAIIALYYTNIDNKWEQIQIQDEEQYYYDYMRRDNNKPYIMHKM